MPATFTSLGTVNEHGYVVIYLHGVHQARLPENPIFTAEFERHGLPVIAPHTGPSWWTDKIYSQFDPLLTAEQHVLRNVVTYVAERWGSVPPRMALLGTSMGGQGALRLAFKHPRTFPLVAALSPAIDYQIRFDEPNAESLREMYPDAESGAPGHRHAARASFELAAQYLVQLRSARLSLARQHRPVAHEAVCPGNHARARSGNLGRRALVGLL